MFRAEVFDNGMVMREGSVSILLSDEVDAVYYACALTGGYVETVTKHWTLIKAGNKRVIVSKYDD